MIYMSENNEGIPPSHVTPDTKARSNPGQRCWYARSQGRGISLGRPLLVLIDPVSFNVFDVRRGGTGEVPMPLLVPHCEGRRW